MRTGITVHLSPPDRKRLQALVGDRNSLQKHVWRARIVLATADGLGTAAIMRTAGVSKTAVWRWQARFMDEGVDGLLRDKTRPPGTPRLPLDVAERVMALTLCDPPGETTHWTGRLMAKVAGVGLTSVQRIWKAHGLAPHRITTCSQSPSSGLPIPTKSSRPPHAGTRRWSQSANVGHGSVAVRAECPLSGKRPTGKFDPKQPSSSSVFSLVEGCREIYCA